MGKIDKIKEQVGWLKIVFGIATAIDVSLIAWIVKNYNNSSVSILILSIVLVLISTAVIVLVNKKAMNKIDELEDL